MSRQKKDEDYIVKVNFDLPDDKIDEAEIKLVTSCLKELLKFVIQETETKRGES